MFPGELAPVCKEVLYWTESIRTSKILIYSDQNSSDCVLTSVQNINSKLKYMILEIFQAIFGIKETGGTVKNIWFVAQSGEK